MDVAFLEKILNCKIQSIKTESEDGRLILWIKSEGLDEYIKFHIKTVSGTV